MIGGNGWISLILITTRSEGSSLVVVIKWHPFAPKVGVWVDPRFWAS